ncbi:hypothetical protein [Dechloromonas denitrificans]|uniref:hypothetical protein n=1 Tax=Dechloromonas denitrificans TaxID=281362 RepID=UPI001CFB1E50|nr:hypothetical protein [Dechloromonas denitrificans]UCV09140.1 hypothetical protein KI615_06325 [Dechloromonas denitrificans]
MNRPLHGLEELPEGKTIGDVCPVFSNVVKELRVGKRSTCCTACRKPFNAIRKPRKEIRLYPLEAVVPVAFAYPVCGVCVAMYQRGGIERESVLAAVESFHYGNKASQ